MTFKEGIELTGISETKEQVTIKCKDKNGKEFSFTGKFLVGADGKVGYVRKNYLEAKGVRQLDSEKYITHTSLPHRLQITIRPMVGCRKLENDPSNP